jgi:hypothetical protein
MKRIFEELKQRRNPDGTINFPVTITGESTFAGFFGYLAPMSVRVNGSEQIIESELGALIIKTPVISKPSEHLPQLHIEAEFIIPFASRWLLYPFLSGARGLVSGNLDMYELVCEFNLYAALENVTIQSAVSNSSVNINLYLRNDLPGSDAISAAGLEVILNLDGLSTPVSFTTSLFQGTDFWWLKTSFANGLGAFDFVNFFIRLFGVKDGNSLLLPANSPINNFKLYELTFGMDYSDTSGLNMRYIRAYLATAQAWQLPLEFLTIDYLRLQWEIQWGAKIQNQKNYLFTGQIAAALTVALPSGLKLTLSGSALIPALLIEASLNLRRSETPPTVNKLIGETAGSVPGGEAGGITLAALNLTADCRQRELSLYAELRLGSVLRFKLGNLDIILARLYAGAQFATSGNTFFIGGEIDFGESDGFTLALKGTYTAPKNADSHWVFRGYLSRGEVSLKSLILHMLKIEQRDIPVDFILSAFDVKYESLNHNFELYAAFRGEWGDILGGLQIKSNGKVWLRSVSGVNTLSVMLALEIAPFAVSAQVNNFPANPDYAFRFAYRQLALNAVYSTEKQELAIQLDKVTLGDIIGFMVELVNPNRTVRFSSPWDF